jgi:hypothetical protein
MPPKGIKKTSFHPTARRQVIATADAQMMQVQVADKNGQIRAIIVWACGPDMYWADTMDGIFDNARRKKAPDWLVEQVKDLPLDRQFYADGTKKTEAVAAEIGAGHVPSDADTDLPQFAQA